MFTQAQLDNIEALIAEGASSNQYEDKRTTYRSQSELFALRDRMRKELGQSGGGIIVSTYQFQPHRDAPGSSD